jgi:hypothetical protein
MARPRKPTEILALNGAFDKDPQRRRATGPKSALGIGEAPDGLLPDEVNCWYEFIRNAPANVLTSNDRWTLERCCCLMAAARRGTITAASEGHLRALLTELGATPASRSKIAAPAGRDEPTANPWDIAPAPLAPGSDARQ